MQVDGRDGRIEPDADSFNKPANNQSRELSDIDQEDREDVYQRKDVDARQTPVMLYQGSCQNGSNAPPDWQNADQY